MYVFALIALAAAVVWHFIERPSPGASAALARFGTVSYGIFALITGVSWLVWPDATARLVPDNNAGMLVAATVQARGVLVVALGVISIVSRRYAPASTLSILLGPLVYNVLLGGEALSAQFTPMATPERWLYVTLHYAWAIAFCLRFVTNEMEPRAKRGLSVAASSTLAVFATLSMLAGLPLYCLSASALAALQSGTTNLFLGHALHGLGAGCTAMGVVAYTTRKEQDARMTLVGLVALIVATLGLAGLALIRAAALEPLESVVRAVALVCALCAAVLCLECRQQPRRGLEPRAPPH